MKKVIFFLSFLCFFQFDLFCQKSPIKYGDVSIEELQTRIYLLDTSAAAVILCDYGYLNSTTLQFTRVRRIKILKKEGLNWANSVYPYDLNTNIKGITLNLENGTIVTDKLRSESIFRDKVTEGRYIARVAMPNVKVGSVIDLQFNFMGIMPEWKFQEDIPVKYSELVMPRVKDVGIKYNFFGYEPLYLSSPTRWIAKDMPSFKEEPFISSKENYLTKLAFDIQYIGVNSITTTWEAISQLLMKDPKFGQVIGSANYLNSLVKTIDISKSDKEEVLKLAFEAVKSSVKWDGNASVVTSAPNLGFIYKMKIGNSADVNLLLLQLLRKLDFEVAPVVISTRENGFISNFSPSLSKLDYVMVLAKIGDRSFLLDATEQYMPYYMIPLRCLNGTGRLVDVKKSEEIILNTKYKAKEFTTYHVKLDENQNLDGKLMIRKIDYSAFDFRKKYKSFNGPEEYLEDFKKDKIGLEIINYKIDNMDSIYNPAIEDYNIKMTNQLNEVGNELYINPMFYHQFKENPFKMDLRQYPVDYGYNIEKSVTTSIEIPENYKVKALPTPINIKLTNNSASLTYIVLQTDNSISIKSIFSINKTMFLPDEYKALKEFYNQVIRKHTEPIIIERN